jgi:hypothetical protein
MHPSLRRVATGLAAAVLSGGCFDFDATMAGGPPSDSGTAADADASVVDSAPSDGPYDASADGADVAPRDSGTAVDSGAPDGPYCASLAQPDGGLFFCDDFDEHALPGSWQVWGEMAGTLSETDASAVSAPNSVDETTMALSNGQVINVALRTPLPLPPLPATLSLSFDLQPVQIDPAAGAAIVLGAIDFLDGSGDRYTVGLAVNVASGKPALALGEQSGVISGGNFPDGAPPTFVNHPLSPTLPLPMNAWSHVVIEVDWSSSNLEGRVLIDGNQELDVPLSMSVVPTSLQIGVGTSYVTTYEAGLSPVWELRYDNVLFTAR